TARARAGGHGHRDLAFAHDGRVMALTGPAGVEHADQRIALELDLRRARALTRARTRARTRVTRPGIRNRLTRRRGAAGRIAVLARVEDAVAAGDYRRRRNRRD